jgi:hypothetical protein
MTRVFECSTGKSGVTGPSRWNAVGDRAVVTDLKAMGGVSQYLESAAALPQMFREFLVPSLDEQCRGLNDSMYHFGGTTAVQHLYALVEIEALDAIERTPQAGMPGGANPQWLDLDRRIRQAEKAVQAVGLLPDEVVPLLGQTCPKGMYTWVSRAIIFPTRGVT